MHHRMTLSVAATALALIAGALTGCAGDSWERSRPAPAAVGTPGPGFVPATAPAPEATIDPAPGSWEGVKAGPGYRVVLLTAGDDAPTHALVSAVQDWAEADGIELRTVAADDDHVAGIVAAMDLNPDLIVTAGNDLIDPLALVTPNHLDRQFLVLGAELAEPTHNVTAVDWTGASFRGEGLGSASSFDPASFTSDRCRAAIRAGIAAVLTGLTGVVVWID